MPEETLTIGRMLAGTGSPLVNYSFEDVTLQTGYRTFYPVCNTSGAINYGVVSNKAIQSTELVSAFFAGELSGAYNDTPLLSRTIVIPFYVPQTVRGIVYMNVPVGYTNTGDAEGAHYQVSGSVYYVTPTGTETLIGSTNQAKWKFVDTTGANLAVQRTALLQLDTSGAYHFRMNDIFRVKINLYCWLNGKYGIVSIGHDPAGRSYIDRAIIYPTTGETCFQIMLPFKLDI